MIRFIVIAALVLCNATAQGAACDRACLAATLDQYLTALVQHDPAAAPLALGFRQTENAQARSLGTGAVLSLALFQRYPGVAMRRNLLARMVLHRAGQDPLDG